MRAPGKVIAGALVLAVVTVGCMPADGSGGTWRTVSWSRADSPDSAALPLAADVSFTAGRFNLRAASEAALYSADLTWNSEGRAQPEHSFDPASRTLQVGLGRAESNVPGDGRSGDGRLRLALTRSVPVAVQVRLAGTASDLDLTGMLVESAQVSGSMSDIRVHIDEPNQYPASLLRLDNRYGRMTATRLGNANVDTVAVHNDIGSAVLDFSGRWSRDMVLQLDASLSRVELRVPDGIGVQVELDDRWSEAPSGWLRDGNRVTSPNWDGARHKLTILGRKTLTRLVVVSG